MSTNAWTIRDPEPPDADTIVDATDKLPEAARRKLRAFRARGDDHRLAARARGARAFEKETEAAPLERAVAQFERDGTALRARHERTVADHRRRLDQLNAEIADERAAQQRLAAAGAGWLALVSRAETYAANKLSGRVSAYAGEIVIPTDANLTRALADQRKKIAEIQAQAGDVLRAPLPLADAKKAVYAEIDELVARSPQFDDFFHFRKPGDTRIRPKIAWPKSWLRVESVSVQGPVIGGTEMLDAAALICWAIPDIIKRAVDAELEACADDEANALNPKQREAKLAELAVAMLDAERVEEAICERLERDGGEIMRRADASIVALLEIDGPPEHPNR